MAQLQNLTPHEVVILSHDGQPMDIIPKSSQIARVKTKEQVIGQIITENGASVPIIKRKRGNIENLPPRRDGHYYIVSKIVADECKSRNDLLVPTLIVRDAKGNRLGCKGLGLVSA